MEDKCTYDIIIRWDTDDQRELVRQKVDEVLNKPCGSVWVDENRTPSTNVYFKESYPYPLRDSEERGI